MNIGTPHTKGAGYFLNNQNDRRTKQEADMQSCAHCQASINMQKWAKKDPQGWCVQEMKPLCDRCGARSAVFGCESFVRQIEAHMEREMRFQQLSKIAGLDTPAAAPQPIVIAGR